MAMNVTEVVWKEYHAKLHAFVRRRIDDHAIVDDIIQDVFLKTYTRLSSLKDEATLESWLYQITRNAVIDHYRTQKPSEELPEWISQPETNLNDQAKQDLETCLMPMINQLPGSTDFIRDISKASKRGCKRAENILVWCKISGSAWPEIIERNDARLLSI
jgi:RNA polymerase sigma-70 factor (ECF subfamily)